LFGSAQGRERHLERQRGPRRPELLGQTEAPLGVPVKFFWLYVGFLIATPLELTGNLNLENNSALAAVARSMFVAPFHWSS
jgi:hypothetical protein